MTATSFEVYKIVSIKLRDAHTHIIWAMFTFIACIISIIWKPDLIKDDPTTLGTFGTFATAYGVIFAILELRRAKSASVTAKEEAERVFKAVTSVVTAREIVECQATIQMALSSVDEGRPIASAVLCQIIKLYSQVFFAQLVDEASIHRKNRSTIESYTFNPSISKSGGSSKKTKQALLSIASQLAELQGSTKNFTEYTK